MKLQFEKIGKFLIEILIGNFKWKFCKFKILKKILNQNWRIDEINENEFLMEIF